MELIKSIGFVVCLIFIIYPIAVSIIYSIKKTWDKNKAIIVLSIFIFSLLINPLTQTIFMERYDTKINNEWKDKAVNLKIIGKTKSEIRGLFGAPTKEWIESPKVIDKDGNTKFKGETFIGWKYHVLPYYWLGSSFEIFFVNDKVAGFEANDD